MLQFITNTDCKIPVIDQLNAVIEGGCKWVQIRMNDSSDDEIRKIVEEIKPKCIEKEVFLILNDKVELAKELNVGGVYLERKDMPASKARMILGPAAVIGVKANTMADILAVSALDIDYFGIGPFRETSTEQNATPALGIDGIRKICYEMTENNILIPHVAFGGVKYEDILPLLEAGVNGVAVSGAIVNAEDMVKETEKFVSAFPQTGE